MGGEGKPCVVACGGDLSYDSPHPVGCLVPRWCLTVFGGSLCRICCLCFDSYVLDCVTAIQWNHGPCVAGPICMRYVGVCRFCGWFPCFYLRGSYILSLVHWPMCVYLACGSIRH